MGAGRYTGLGGPLDDKERMRMYSRSGVSLEFANVGDTHRTTTPVSQVRLRDFEGPMSGAVYMPQWNSAMDKHCAAGKEAVCFSDSRDLVAKIACDLQPADGRESIQAAGQQRAPRDHTWQRRLSQNFIEMGLG